MIGTTQEELKDKLMNGHEVEFIFNNIEYSIEPNNENDKNVVKIWKCSKEIPVCIAEIKFKTEKDLEELFKLKCFDEKSFEDIESQVVVENIF